MSKSHRYELKLHWSGAEKGPTENYAKFSREYRIEIPGKPPIKGSADPAYQGALRMVVPSEAVPP